MARSKRQRRKQRQRRLAESAVAAAPPGLGRKRLDEAGGALCEAVAADGTKRKVTIIRAGWGSSGYYSEAVLSRDGGVFGPGTHMYLNHPSASEESDRPERDLRDLVGVITSKPKMEGGDLTAEAAVYEHWAPVINAMADDIGVSIRAIGAYESGEAEGRTGNIITSLDEGLSVDYVTQAGAGGKIGPLIESARKADLEEARNAGQWIEAAIHRDFTLTADGLFGDGHVTRDERIALSGAIGEALDAFSAKLQDAAPSLYQRDPYSEPDSASAGVSERKAVEETVQPSDEEDVMSDEEKQQLADLQETVNKLTQKVDDLTSELSEAKAGKERAEDALLRSRAERVVESATAKKDGEEGESSIYDGLPERAVSRVKEVALSGDLPKTEDGKLDEAKLIERAGDAAKEEREYLVSAGVKPGQPVTGFGESRSEDKVESDSKELEESFRRLGLGEDAAKVAAGGR